HPLKRVHNTTLYENDSGSSESHRDTRSRLAECALDMSTQLRIERSQRAREMRADDFCDGHVFVHEGTVEGNSSDLAVGRIANLRRVHSALTGGRLDATEVRPARTERDHGDAHGRRGHRLARAPEVPARQYNRLLHGG